MPVSRDLSDRARPLTPDDIAYASRVFAGSIDYANVRITRGHLAAYGIDRALGNTVHLRPDRFFGGTVTLSAAGRSVLIHELAHVWQYQHFGLGYIPAALWDQLRAWLTTGSRNGAYDWRRPLAAGRPWQKWGPEQQAQACQFYDRCLLAQEQGRATPVQRAELAALTPYLDEVRGQGLP